MPSKGTGLLVVVTGPSAVGKGTICRQLLKEAPDLRFSVSCTTRKARPGEIDGVEYFFISEEEFRRRIDRGEMLEWAEVYGNLYGTPRKNVEETTALGQNIILDIDMVGAANVRKEYEDAVSVFVIPPSMKALEKRIQGRGTETAEAVARRLQEAPRWIEKGLDYHYVIVNDDLDTAVAQLRAVVVAERCRTARHGGALIRQLLQKGELD
ncbi:MAG TPA: guanylate kinase [Symbiobacteriaceae bacterium]|jgi:guanylate kinase